jgi:ribose 5-phosphate isomerase A
LEIRKSELKSPFFSGGGGCLAQEKVIAEAAKLFVVIADHRKKVEHLGTAWKYVPIEVLPLAYKPLQLKIQVKITK